MEGILLRRLELKSLVIDFVVDMCLDEDRELFYRSESEFTSSKSLNTSSSEKLES